MEQKNKMLIRARLKKQTPLKITSEQIQVWLEQEEDETFHHLFLQQLELNPQLNPSLLFRYLEQNWETRMNVARGVCFLEAEVEDLLEILLEDQEVAVLIATVESIARRGYRQFLPQIFAFEGRDPELDVAIIEAIVLEASEPILKLLERFLSSSDYRIRTTVMQKITLAHLTPKMLQRLLETLVEPNWSLRKIAVEALGRLRHEEGLRQMLQFVAQENESVLESMGASIFSEDVLSQDILLQKTQEEANRAGATYLLGFCAKEKTQQRLLELTSDSQELVRRYARKSLARQRYEEDWNFYFKGMQEEDWKSRLDLVKNLAWLLSEKKLELLWKGLEDPYWAIGRESFQQIQQLFFPQVETYLVKCLSLSDAWIRQQACREIGKRNLVQYRQDVEKLQMDSDFLIRKEAAGVLLAMSSFLKNSGKNN